MKQVVIIISILWSVLFAHAQDQESMILKQDFACLFDSLSMIGILGKDCSRSECTEIDGFIYGHYWFTEHGDKRYSGVFSGSFKQAYRIIGKQADKGWNEIPELKLNVSEYTGKWKSANGTTKVCPCNDFLATDEIQKARAIEEQKWWVDKTPPRNTD